MPDFSVGQDNLSVSTDQILVVRVIANNKEIEFYRVPFINYLSFSLDIPEVNALRTETCLDEVSKNYGDGSALAVFFDVKLQ